MILRLSLALLLSSLFPGDPHAAARPAVAPTEEAAPLRVGTASAGAGEASSGWIEIPDGRDASDAGTRIPVSVVRGARPGPVLALVAGTHGYEYTSILALQRLLPRLDPKRMSGAVILVHMANPPAFWGRRIYVGPDGKNLNRVYPGDPEGTQSDRIAAALTREVIDRATHLIDMHCGDGNESLRPYSYWTISGDRDLDEAGREMALAYGLDHIVIDRDRPKDPARSVYTATTAILRGKPAITTESGGVGLTDESSVGAHEAGALGVIGHLGIMDAPSVKVPRPVWIVRSEVVRAPVTGVWRPTVGKEQRVAAGALLGRLSDPFGRVLHEIRAPFAGEILYVVVTPPVSQGEPLAMVGETASDLPVASVPAPELLVYSAIRPANWDLYLFEKPGLPGRALTDDTGLDYNASVSPDGRFIVFVSEREGQADLYVLDRQQEGPPRRLTRDAAMEDAPVFSPDGKRLAFVSTRDGSADIFSMPFDARGLAPYGSGPGLVGLDGKAGEGAVNLTHAGGGDFNPAFSPDGRFIAFSSNRHSMRYGNSASPPPDYQAGDIHVMRADGTDVRRLTQDPGWEGTPAWSPDGRSLYYYAVRQGTPRIFRMGRDGSAPRPVSPEGVAAHSPSFSGDGRLAYAAFRRGVWSIVSMKTDGSDPRVESDPQRDAWAPVWDPLTGGLIAHGPGLLDLNDLARAEVTGPFRIPGHPDVSLPDRRLMVVAIRGYFPALHPSSGELATSPLFRDIEVSRLDGTGRREILNLEGRAAWKPSWAPSGAWLAAVVGPPFGGLADNADVFRVQRDGGGAVNLTTGSGANDAFPDVSPDGRSIVFRSGRDGNHELYFMNADGSHPRRLTHHEAADTMPAFSPRGDRIAFASDREGDYEIFLLDVGKDGDPGALGRLTRHPGLDTHPVFSPDGRWIAYASERGGLNDETPLIPVFNAQPYGEIYATRIEDGLTVRLTHNKWEDGLPEWGAARGSEALDQPDE